MMIAVPPMATMFFQCTLGSALTYSVFTPTGGKPGPQGQPAGSWGQGALAASGRNNISHDSASSIGGFSNMNTHRVSNASPVVQGEGIKDGRRRCEISYETHTYRPLPGWPSALTAA